MYKFQKKYRDGTSDPGERWGGGMFTTTRENIKKIMGEVPGYFQISGPS